MRDKLLRRLSMLTLLFAAPFAQAETFPLYLPQYESMVGELRYVRATHESTLIDIARYYNVGYNEIVAANPTVNRWVPGEGTMVIIPSRYVLPDAPREGIVVNLSELRLYYFPRPEVLNPLVVITHPVSVGRMDWKTPLGRTKVAAKQKDPPWYPPESIRAEHAAEGDPLPKVIPGGDPENPLGRFALKLSIPTYLIHGVDERKANGIGMRVTHGCIRMYPEDIESLYRAVAVDTPVYLVDQPLKAGWREGKLFLEVHQPLEEEESDRQVTLEDAERLVWEKAAGQAKIDFEAVARAVRVGNGVPTPVAFTTSSLPPAKEENRKVDKRGK